MKYYYGGEINGREFLYKNFIRRDNEPDDDLRADVFPPSSPLLLRENNKEARKGWELVRAWKRFLYFLSYRRFLRNYWSLITCKLHETRWYLEWSFSFPFASRGIVRLNNKERERKIVRRMKLNYVWTIFFYILNWMFLLREFKFKRNNVIIPWMEK